MIILRPYNVAGIIFTRPDQAMGTMRFIKSEQLCPIHNDLPVFISDTAVFERPHSDQLVHKLLDDLFQLCRIQFFQIIIDC